MNQLQPNKNKVKYNVVFTVKMNGEYMYSEIPFIVSAEFEESEPILARGKALEFYRITKAAYEILKDFNEKCREKPPEIVVIDFTINHIDVFVTLLGEERQLVKNIENLQWEFQVYKENNWKNSGFMVLNDQKSDGIMLLKDQEKEAVMLYIPINLVR